LDLERIIADLKQERDRLSRAIAALEESNSPRAAKTTGCQDHERRQATPAGIEGEEAWRAHSGGQKAAIVSDEETLGGTQNEGLISSVIDRVPLPPEMRSVELLLISRSRIGRIIERARLVTSSRRSRPPSQ
jgi:hypothetical protein